MGASQEQAPQCHRRPRWMKRFFDLSPNCRGFCLANATFFFFFLQQPKVTGAWDRRKELGTKFQAGENPRLLELQHPPMHISSFGQERRLHPCSLTPRAPRGFGKCTFLSLPRKRCHLCGIPAAPQLGSPANRHSTTPDGAHTYPGSLAKDNRGQ